MYVSDKMYPCVRRRDTCSIGFWSYPVGRPTDDSVKKWVQRCNFTVKVMARLEDAESRESCGWLVKVKTQSDHSHLLSISSEQASSHMKMRQHIMRHVNGTVCRMKADDFLAFVDEDKCSKVAYMSRHIGKIQVEGSPVWYFPTMKVGDAPVFFEEALVRSSGVALPTLPRPAPLDSLEKRTVSLRKLGNAMRVVYGHERFARILHLCTSVLKAIRFDDLMSAYHFVPVTNISGPANCGKTLGSAIVLSMLECSSLMLSRCTPSAMIDAADTFKNLAIVWDDPRDCSHAQMSSIVHEAFNGLTTSLVTRGLRKYNSLIIVGTQERNLGMPQTSMNTATFSRLSHIDMDVSDAQPFASDKEADLQAILKDDMHGMLSFFISVAPFERKKIDAIYDKMLTHLPHIIGRSVHIAAIDRYYMSILSDFMGFNGVDAYFDNDYSEYLNVNCGKSDAVERFCADLKTILLRYSDIPSACFKEKLTIDLKHYGPTECFAVYTKDFLPYLQQHIGRRLSYTKEQLHHAMKSTPKYGEVSRNVAYRVKTGTFVRRSLVIRQMFIM